MQLFQSALIFRANIGMKMAPFQCMAYFHCHVTQDERRGRMSTAGEGDKRREPAYNPISFPPPGKNWVLIKRDYCSVNKNDMPSCRQGKRVEGGMKTISGLLYSQEFCLESGTERQEGWISTIGEWEGAQARLMKANEPHWKCQQIADLADVEGREVGGRQEGKEEEEEGAKTNSVTKAPTST